MKIIPVIDILNGEVVHAVRGERDNYMPVKSTLAEGSDPLEIAKVLTRVTGSNHVYIADLDAILNRGSNRELFPLLKSIGISLMVDAGVSDAGSALDVKRAGADKIIIGTETISDIDQLTEIAKQIDSDGLVMSIDIKKGVVLSKADELNGVAPLEAIKKLTGKGIKNFIILTLDLVGSGEGPDAGLINQARREFPSHTLISGGGVKSHVHLRQLNAAGADGVLVATALHRGWITRNHIFNNSI
ncbi:MAG: nickel transporter [Deltaproteobacteria bacterium]|nr:nickel transporter [Deltaproteobacteria bacterium]